MTQQQQTQVQNPRVAFDAVLERIGASFVGDPTLLRKVLAAALANGHVLFEDYPGLGKTLLVKVTARVLGAQTRRVQFTPDILPADITGTKVWDTERGSFRLERGPIFTNVLLADEINRAPPKTQSALLEAMEERQVTIEGETHPLAPPFFVLATQNPIEQEGTYPLPEAQMDRFLMKLSTGYPPNLAAEREILKRRISWQKEDPTNDIQPIMDAETFRRYQLLCESRIFIHDDVLDYISTLVRELRTHPRLEIGPSPRGALALLRTSRALALLHGRDFVTPDDVRGVAIECLAHRCIVEMEQSLEGYKGEDAVIETLNKVRPPYRFKRGA